MSTKRPPPMVNLSSQKMGIHEWSYDNDISNDHRYKVPHAPIEKTLKDVRLEVELGFDIQQAFLEAERCLNCDVQTVFDTPKCIECDACVDICPMDCITFTANGEESDLRDTADGAGAACRTRTFIFPPCLKTGRIMAKDEDLCLHCGLCAERCPTGAWDMQKFLLNAPKTGYACRPIKAVNDFVVKFANVNGSGSASANEMFARSILRMGVPVASRNIFPSNIQGLPTWYEVRVSGHGWLGRRGGVDLMVAMNPQTWDKDVASIDPGGYLFYDSSRPIPPSKFRDDINIIRMPLTEICNAAYNDPRQRQLFKNIIYVGALAQLLGIDLAVLEKLIGEQYKGKDALIAPNHQALRMGHDHARDNLSGHVRPQDRAGRRGGRPHFRQRQ